MVGYKKTFARREERYLIRRQDFEKFLARYQNYLMPDVFFGIPQELILANRVIQNYLHQLTFRIVMKRFFELPKFPEIWYVFNRCLFDLYKS